MKDLFKHASSSWVKYDRYEWKKDKNNKFYITPAPNAMPKIYDPLKEYQQMVLDALNVGLMIRTSSKRKIREAIMEFVTKYGLLGLMTALPTTPSFIDYKAVYLPTNHFLREEVMDTQKYLFYFFPFEKPDFFKNGKDSLWNIKQDRTMIALAMTFRKEPEAQVMCFMRNYAERYDWLEQTFQDWSFTFLSSFLFYEEDEEMDEDTRDIYRQGMAAFGGIAPTAVLLVWLSTSSPIPTSRNPTRNISRHLLISIPPTNMVWPSSEAHDCSCLPPYYSIYPALQVSTTRERWCILAT